MKKRNGLFRPLDPNLPIEKHQRKLPHWTQPGATYFITFRTWDSLPAVLVKALQIEKRVWLECHPKPWCDAEKRYYYRRFHGQIERWLDAGHGAGYLKDSELAGIVEESLLHFDGDRYSLDEYSVMPNHNHAIVQPQTHTLKQILRTWKSYTANQLNRRLGKRGHFWMDETFDHLIRTVTSFRHFQQYILANPRKAGLQEGEYILGKGTGIRVPEE